MAALFLQLQPLYLSCCDAYKALRREVLASRRRGPLVGAMLSYMAQKTLGRRPRAYER